MRTVVMADGIEGGFEDGDTFGVDLADGAVAAVVGEAADEKVAVFELLGEPCGVEETAPVGGVAGLAFGVAEADHQVAALVVVAVAGRVEGLAIPPHGVVGCEGGDGLSPAWIA